MLRGGRSALSEIGAVRASVVKTRVMMRSRRRMAAVAGRCRTPSLCDIRVLGYWELVGPKRKFPRYMASNEEKFLQLHYSLRDQGFLYQLRNLH